jgi:putative hemolysin
MASLWMNLVPLKGSLPEALVGDLPDNNSEPPAISKRTDGSLLVNGNILVEDLNEFLDMTFIPDKSIHYSTLAGFIIQHLERIPNEGDQFEYNGRDIEIVDKDGARIDKVLLK